MNNETTTNTIPESPLFVDALRSLLDAGEKIRKAFDYNYGRKEGYRLSNEAGIFEKLNDLRNTLKPFIGDEAEIRILGYAVGFPEPVPDED